MSGQPWPHESPPSTSNKVQRPQPYLLLHPDGPLNTLPAMVSHPQHSLKKQQQQQQQQVSKDQLGLRNRTPPVQAATIPQAVQEALLPGPKAKQDASIQQPKPLLPTQPGDGHPKHEPLPTTDNPQQDKEPTTDPSGSNRTTHSNATSASSLSGLERRDFGMLYQIQESNPYLHASVTPKDADTEDTKAEPAFAFPISPTLAAQHKGLTQTHQQPQQEPRLAQSQQRLAFPRSGASKPTNRAGHGTGETIAERRARKRQQQLGLATTPAPLPAIPLPAHAHANASVPSSRQQQQQLSVNTGKVSDFEAFLTQLNALRSAMPSPPTFTHEQLLVLYRQYSLQRQATATCYARERGPTTSTQHAQHEHELPSPDEQLQRELLEKYREQQEKHQSNSNSNRRTSSESNGKNKAKVKSSHAALGPSSLVKQESDSNDADEETTLSPERKRELDLIAYRGFGSSVYDEKRFKRDSKKQREGRIKRNHETADIRKWLRENYVRDADTATERKSVFLHYCHHCEWKQITPINAASFGKILRLEFPDLKTRRLGIRGQSKYHYFGFRRRARKDDGSDDAGDSQHASTGKQAKTPVSAKSREKANNGSVNMAGISTRLLDQLQGAALARNVNGATTTKTPSSMPHGIFSSALSAASRQTSSAPTQHHPHSHFPFLSNQSLAPSSTLATPQLASLLALRNQSLVSPATATTTATPRHQHQYQHPPPDISDIISSLQEMQASVLRIFSDGNMDEVSDVLIQYWTSLSQEDIEKLGDVRNGHKVLKLFRVFFASVVSLGIPDLLGELSHEQFHRMRLIAKWWEHWSHEAMRVLPDYLVRMYDVVAHRFVMTLMRQTSVNYAAQALAAAMAKEPGLAEAMRMEFESLNLASLYRFLSLTMNPEVIERVQRARQSFLQLFDAPSPPTPATFASWFGQIASECAFSHAPVGAHRHHHGTIGNASNNEVKIRRKRRTLAFLKTWNIISMRILGDLTIEQTETMPLFHLLKVFLDEYLMHIMEKRETLELDEAIKIGAAIPAISPPTAEMLEKPPPTVAKPAAIAECVCNHEVLLDPLLEHQQCLKASMITTGDGRHAASEPAKNQVCSSHDANAGQDEVEDEDASSSDEEAHKKGISSISTSAPSSPATSGDGTHGDSAFSHFIGEPGLEFGSKSPFLFMKGPSSGNPFSMSLPPCERSPQRPPRLATTPRLGDDGDTHTYDSSAFFGTLPTPPMSLTSSDGIGHPLLLPFPQPSETSARTFASLLLDTPMQGTTSSMAVGDLHHTRTNTDQRSNEAETEAEPPKRKSGMHGLGPRNTPKKKQTKKKAGENDARSRQPPGKGRGCTPMKSAKDSRQGHPAKHRDKHCSNPAKKAKAAASKTPAGLPAPPSGKSLSQGKRKSTSTLATSSNSGNMLKKHKSGKKEGRSPSHAKSTPSPAPLNNTHQRAGNAKNAKLLPKSQRRDTDSSARCKKVDTPRCSPTLPLVMMNGEEDVKLPSPLPAHQQHPDAMSAPTSADDSFEAASFVGESHAHAPGLQMQDMDLLDIDRFPSDPFGDIFEGTFDGDGLVPPLAEDKDAGEEANAMSFL